MARTRDLRITISGDARGLGRGVKDAERDLGKLQRVSVSSTRGLSAAFKAAGSVIAGAAIADQLRQTVKAAQEAEVSQKRMSTQLRALGINYQAHAKQIDLVIQKTSQLSGLDDEDLQDSFTNIVRATGDVNKALRGTTIAADLARAKHMDLGRAGDLVAKVYNGNVGALKRMGIAIDPVTKAQDKLKESTKHATVEQTRAAKEADKTATAQKALGELQKRVGGQAAAYGKTASGAQDRFRVAVENLRERIGKALLPELTKVTNKVATFVNQMSNGTGAGGRFADKLKDIANRVKPIVKFFGDHPRLIAGAIAAWATYRAAVATATAVSRLKMLGMFKGLARPAAAAGAESGAAFGAASNTAAGAAMRRGKWSRVGTGIGGALGVAAGIAMVGELTVQFNQWVKSLPGFHAPGGKGGFLDQLIPDRLLPPNPFNKKNLKGPLGRLLGGGGGGKTPNRSGQSPFRPSTHLGALPSQHRSGNKPRAHGAVAHAAVAGSTRTTMRATAHAAAAQPHPDDIVAAIEQRADTIDAAHVPYAWGGGHAGRFTGKVIPMDCSGAVSAALGIDPRVSGDFVTWGSPGDGGSTGVTIYANKTHVLMKINGRFWGTSRSNPGGGPGWIEGGVSPGYLNGFTARDMGGVTGGSTAALVSRRPKITTAHLERGQSGVSRRGGARLPKLSGADRIGIEPGAFVAAPTQEQIDLLTGDPTTDPKARLARQFQLGTRRNKILEALKSGRIRNPATRQRLLEELTGISSELGQLAQPIDTGATGPGDVGDPNQPLIDAQNAAAEAAQELKNSIDELHSSIDQQNKFAESVAATSAATATRLLADVLSGEVGSRIGQRQLTPGGGVRARY